MVALTLTLLNVFKDIGSLQILPVLVNHQNAIPEILWLDHDELAFPGAFDDIVWHPVSLLILVHPELLLDSPAFYLLLCEVEELIGTGSKATPHLSNLLQGHQFIFTLLQYLEEYLRRPYIFPPFGTNIPSFFFVKPLLPKLGL